MQWCSNVSLDNAVIANLNYIFIVCSTFKKSCNSNFTVVRKMILKMEIINAIWYVTTFVESLTEEKQHVHGKQ